MAHTLTISIPTKEEVKEKTSAFWNKHKKTIVAGGAIVGGGVLYAYLNKDSEHEDQYSIEDDDAVELAGPYSLDSVDGSVTADFYVDPDSVEIVTEPSETPIAEND